MTSDTENRPYGSAPSTGSLAGGTRQGYSGSGGTSQSGFGQGSYGQSSSSGEEGNGTSSAVEERASDVKNAVGREASSARAEIGNATEQVKQGVADIGETARAKAAEGIDKGKAQITSSLADFAAAIRKASKELGERDQSMAAGLVREVANGLEEATGAIHGQSVQDLTRSVAAFARRQPTTFLIGAALAGVALGRFARASGEHHHPRSGEADGWREGSSARPAYGSDHRNPTGGVYDRDEERASSPSTASRPVSPPVSAGTTAPRSAMAYGGSTIGASTTTTATGSTSGSSVTPGSTNSPGSSGSSSTPSGGPAPAEGPSGAVLGHGSGSFNPQGGRDVR